MRRSYCLLSAAVLLALGVIGLAVPTRESAPPAVTEAPEATPAPAASEPVEIVLKRGETLETALRRTGVERGGRGRDRGRAARQRQHAPPRPR